MIAVDTNILVYAHRGDSPFHEAASSCVRGLAQGRATWCLLWQCVHEFLGVVTHPRIYDPPSPIDVALAQVDAWLESPSVVLLTEPEDYWATLRSQVQAGLVAGPRIHDARIASVCLSNGIAELWSADRDFTRFGELVVGNPWAGARRTGGDGASSSSVGSVRAGHHRPSLRFRAAGLSRSRWSNLARPAQMRPRVNGSESLEVACGSRWPCASLGDLLEKRGVEQHSARGGEHRGYLESTSRLIVWQAGPPSRHSSEDS